MTDVRDLIQDLRAYAHEAPSVCAALMRRAARELEQQMEDRQPEPKASGKHQRPRCEECADTGQIYVGTRIGERQIRSCECQRERSPCR